jgi:hypothetical protein
MTIPDYYKAKTFFVEKNESHVKNLFVTINSVLQSRTVNLNIVKNYVGGVIGETKVNRKIAKIITDKPPNWVICQM